MLATLTNRSIRRILESPIETNPQPLLAISTA